MQPVPKIEQSVKPGGLNSEKGQLGTMTQT